MRLPVLAALLGALLGLSAWAVSTPAGIDAGHGGVPVAEEGHAFA